MADSAPTHPEECSGSAVSSSADSTSTGTDSAGYAVARATCIFAGKRAEAAELLHWVNACLGTTYGKVDDLSSEEACYQFTDMLFAGAVNMSKVKLRAEQGR